MNNDIAIKVENLSKIYKLYNAPIDRMKEALHPFKKKYHKDFYALNAVSFEIKKGETVGVIGKNGAGKSTLLKIITGVLSPTIGKVTVNGRVSALLELGAGFNPEYTGLENIYFQGNLMGFSQDEMAARVDDILKFADIGDFIYQPVKNYSSGMFARLAFAVAINVEPEIFIVDEALSVGDMFFQEKCLMAIRQRTDSGLMTVLFVSHSLPSIRNFCDKAIWLMDGTVEQNGSAIKITQEYEKFYDKTMKKNSLMPDSIDDVFEYVTKIDLMNSNHKAIIESIILDKEEIITDDDISFTLKIKSIDKKLKLVCGLILYNQEKKLISLFSILRDGFYLTGKTEYIINLKIPQCDLLKGEYFISASLTDDQAMAIYDIQDYCMKFNVSNRRNSHNGLPVAEGLVRLKHEWNY